MCAKVRSSYPATDKRFQRRLGKTLIAECTLRTLHFFALTTDVTRNEKEQCRGQRASSSVSLIFIFLRLPFSLGAAQQTVIDIETQAR
jgi:hypothetical protein